MANIFGATSTTDDVLSGVNRQGKRILVTGVSAGIGVETARSLAVHGAHVVGAARDLTKAQAATAQVRTDAAKRGGNSELVELDLANLQSTTGRGEKSVIPAGQVVCPPTIGTSYAWKRPPYRPKFLRSRRAVVSRGYCLMAPISVLWVRAGSGAACAGRDKQESMLAI